MLPCTSILVAMQYLLIFFKSMNIPAGKYTEFACDAEDKSQVLCPSTPWWEHCLLEYSRHLSLSSRITPDIFVSLTFLYFFLTQFNTRIIIDFAKPLSRTGNHIFSFILVEYFSKSLFHLVWIYIIVAPLAVRLISSTNMLAVVVLWQLGKSFTSIRNIICYRWNWSNLIGYNNPFRADRFFVSGSLWNATAHCKMQLPAFSREIRAVKSAIRAVKYLGWDI
jgi:hypothetical protein